MKKQPHLLSRCLRRASLISIALCAIIQSSGNTPPDLESINFDLTLFAHLDFPQNRVLDLASAEGKFEVIKLAPDESVTISVTWPESLEQPVRTVASLDGGVIDFGPSGELAVTDERVSTLSFSTSGVPGLYRLCFQADDVQWELVFSVPNLAAPEDNPGSREPEIAGATPSPTP